MTDPFSTSQPQFLFWAFFPKGLADNIQTSTPVEPAFSCVEDAVEFIAERLSRFNDHRLYYTVTESQGAVVALESFSRDIDRKPMTKEVEKVHPQMMARAGAPHVKTLAFTWSFRAKTRWHVADEPLLEMVQALLEKKLSR